MRIVCPHCFTQNVIADDPSASSGPVRCSHCNQLLPFSRQDGSSLDATNLKKGMRNENSVLFSLNDFQNQQNEQKSGQEKKERQEGSALIDIRRLAAQALATNANQGSSSSQEQMHVSLPSTTTTSGSNSTSTGVSPLLMPIAPKKRFPTWMIVFMLGGSLTICGVIAIVLIQYYQNKSGGVSPQKQIVTKLVDSVLSTDPSATKIATAQTVPGSQPSVVTQNTETGSEKRNSFEQVVSSKDESSGTMKINGEESSLEKQVGKAVSEQESGKSVVVEPGKVPVNEKDLQNSATKTINKKTPNPPSKLVASHDEPPVAINTTKPESVQTGRLVEADSPKPVPVEKPTESIEKPVEAVKPKQPSKKDDIDSLLDQAVGTDGQTPKKPMVEELPEAHEVQGKIRSVLSRINQEAFSQCIDKNNPERTRSTHTIKIYLNSSGKAAASGAADAETQCVIRLIQGNSQFPKIRESFTLSFPFIF